jgi:hypothetical protein
MVEPTETQIADVLESGEFDADWYRDRYPDVSILGMDPLEHYLRYGHRMNRDPGPGFSTRFARAAYGMGAEKEPLAWLAWFTRHNGQPVQPFPNRVLKAAQQVAISGDHTRAIALADAYLPAERTYTVEMLRANAALARADMAGWQSHVNDYLAQFGAAPIRLMGEGTVFERLSCDAMTPVTGGPLVSVIMPAWNAEAYVRKAAMSILEQTWRNLELLIVDDMSTDGTWTVLQDIAARDDRVRLLRNKVNVGPYVSKNMALLQARGDWITGQDADDWAHPQRLERHLAEALSTGSDASLTHMVRMKPTGEGTFARIVSAASFDGVARIASVSCLFRTDFMRSRLGFWDSVRFAADSEMIERAEKVLGERFGTFRQVGMFCLDLETSLTNHPEFGIGEKGVSPTRRSYRESFERWHEQEMLPETAFLPFPQHERRIEAPQDMIVPLDAMEQNLSNAGDARGSTV